MVTTRMKTTHELAYPVSRAIEMPFVTGLFVTVDVLSLDSDLFWLQR